MIYLELWIKETFFQKEIRTNWSVINYTKLPRVINDTIPSYRINNLPERYNQALLKKSQISIK